MEIKGGTMALSSILCKALPHVQKTGIVNHLTAIKPDPNGHGKAVTFKWDKRDFLMTSNLIVKEFRFGIQAPTMRFSNEMTEKLMKRVLTVVLGIEKRKEKAEAAKAAKIKKAEKAAQRAAAKRAQRAAKKTAIVIEQEKTPVTPTTPTTPAAPVIPEVVNA